MNIVEDLLPDVNHAKLFKAHLQGAIVRSVASFVMWLFALLAFWVDEIQGFHFIGISCSVLFLIIINPPTLFFLRRTARNSVYASISLSINLLENLGYTAVIYFLGGIEATYLTPIYAANIAYVGAMSPRKRPFIIAIFCAFAFGSMVALDGLGIIPSQKVDPHFNLSLSAQFFRAFAVIALLFIVAYISSFTAGKLTKAHNRLRRKNNELEEKTIKLENSQRELKGAHNQLEALVVKLQTEIDERKQVEKEREGLINELKKALKEIKTLRGILPICSFCKKIRDDKGYWSQVEVYIHKHSQADFSHSICPDCAKKHGSNLYKRHSPDSKGSD